MDKQVAQILTLPTGTKKGSLKQLRARHLQILRLDLLGFKTPQIADLVQLTPSAINTIKGSDLYQMEIARLQEKANDRAVEKLIDVDVPKKIEELSKVSILELESILRDKFEDPKLKADIAFDILDRAGHAAPEKHEHAHAHLHAFADGLKEAHARRKRRLEAVPNRPALDTTTEVVDPTPTEEP